ncbi:MAG: type III pantothenate kinase [Flavipsychrobacter sp.]|nr:type III pantothenate kinase [Flavipsychrobacter sp.]
MSINLCIDWGNTNVKAAIFNDEQITDTFTFPAAEAVSGLEAVISSHNAQKAILCSVVDHPYGVEQALSEKIKSFIKLNSNTSLPIMNAYLSPESLGNDRIALATAAYMQNEGKNTLAISLGTCITYNFVQKNKTFRGGAISPGLQMRLKAMHEFTDKLPEVPVQGELLLLGYDTATCMRSGTIFGMAAEIDGMIKEFESQYSDFNAVLTGGDAPYFASKIKSKIFADPDLLMKGLNLILKHNVPIPR